MPCRCRPLHAHRATSAPYFDSDYSLGGVRWQRYRDKALATLDSRARHRGPYCNRVPTAFGRLDPTMQHGRVETSSQSHGRNRYAGLLARTHRFGFEMCTMSSSTATAGVDQLIHSIHVNAYLLS
jgi:hypothetical protein